MSIKPMIIKDNKSPNTVYKWDLGFRIDVYVCGTYTDTLFITNRFSLGERDALAVIEQYQNERENKV